MKFGIYSNLTRDIDGKSARRLAMYFIANNIPFCMSDELSLLNIDTSYYDNKNLAIESDVIITFGGDGTILRIVKDCAKYETPIFAINVGNIGFLTEIENVRVEEAIGLIRNGEMIVDDRALLCINYKGQIDYALNEVVVARGARTKMVRAEVFVDHFLVDRITADGIIVSTPTGSTAYSLSSGGPIIAPEVDAFVITPASPHSLHSRPIVISNKSKVTINLLKAEPNAYLNIDGDDISEMQVGDKVEIYRSNLRVKFLRFEYFNFYAKLLEKLKYWAN